MRETTPRGPNPTIDRRPTTGSPGPERRPASYGDEHRSPAPEKPAPTSTEPDLSDLSPEQRELAELMMPGSTSQPDRRPVNDTGPVRGGSATPVRETTPRGPNPTIDRRPTTGSPGPERRPASYGDEHRSPAPEKPAPTSTEPDLSDLSPEQRELAELLMPGSTGQPVNDTRPGRGGPSSAIDELTDQLTGPGARRDRPEADGVVTGDELNDLYPQADRDKPAPTTDKKPPKTGNPLVDEMMDPKNSSSSTSPYLSDLLLPGVDLGSQPPPKDREPARATPPKIGKQPDLPPGVERSELTDFYLGTLRGAEPEPKPIGPRPDLSSMDPIEQDEAITENPLLTPYFSESDRRDARERLETDQAVRDGLISPEDDPNPERDDVRDQHAPPEPEPQAEDENGWDHLHDSTSGYLSELTFGLVDIGGNKESGYYKSGQGASYIPWNPASAVKSAGTGIVKGGAKLVGKEAAEEAGEKAVKETTEEVGERTGRETLENGVARNADEGLTAPTRRSWQQSEQHVADDLAQQGYKPQESFIGGKPARYGQKGSSRPDYSRRMENGGIETVEVKNYILETSAGRSRLVRNVAAQSKKGSVNLPKGSRQTFRMDVSGQNLTRRQLADLTNRIIEKSGGRVRREDISFFY